MKLNKALVSLAFMSFATSGFSYNFDDLSLIGKQNQVHIGPAFMTSKTEYETKKGSQKYDNDRKMFGVSASGTLGDETAVFGQFGRIMSAEISADGATNDTKGDGYIFGAGAKTEAFRGAKTSAVAFMQFNYLSEDFKTEIPNSDKTIRHESSIYELSIGGILAVTSNPKFTPYFGVEMFPIHKGEMKTNQSDLEQAGLVKADTKTETRTEFQRDDILSLKLGANSRFDQFTVRGEVSMISDMTFTLGTGFLF